MIGKARLVQVISVFAGKGRELYSINLVVVSFD